MRRAISLIGLGFACGVALMPAARAEVIGATTAVQPEAQQTPDGGVARSLANGDPINLLDQIVTSAEGLAQILFADDSTLSVGPNSDVLIDEFVYDGSGGSLAIEMGAGVLRYVGGHISKGEDVEIDTPQGTIGIRGGMVLVQVGSESWAAHQYGILTCSAGGQTEVITTRGFACILGADGVQVVAVPKDKYDALLKVMLGQGGSENDGITGLIDLFCDSGFAENHKDCLAPPGGLAHTQEEDLGVPDEAIDEAEIAEDQQDEPPPVEQDLLCDLNPNLPACI
jgi:hypothetical protein